MKHKELETLTIASIETLTLINKVVFFEGCFFGGEGSQFISIRTYQNNFMQLLNNLFKVC